MKKKKVILDCNIWISYAIGKSVSGDVRKIVLHRQIEVLASEELIREFTEVAKRPKLQKYLSEEHLLEAVSLLQELVTIVDVNSKISLVRDKKDDYLLALSADGGADYLVTGDQDLLVLGRYGTTQIMTLKHFLAVAEKLIMNS